VVAKPDGTFSYQALWGRIGTPGVGHKDWPRDVDVFGSVHDAQAFMDLTEATKAKKGYVRTSTDAVAAQAVRLALLAEVRFWSSLICRPFLADALVAAASQKGTKAPKKRKPAEPKEAKEPKAKKAATPKAKKAKKTSASVSPTAHPEDEDEAPKPKKAASKKKKKV